jgi:hypothetical protein
MFTLCFLCKETFPSAIALVHTICRSEVVWELFTYLPAMLECIYRYNFFTKFALRNWNIQRQKYYNLHLPEYLLYEQGPGSYE